MNKQKAFHDLMLELRDKERKQLEQNHRDMKYVMAMRNGNPHDGVGVTAETKQKADAIVAAL